MGTKIAVVLALLVSLFPATARADHFELRWTAAESPFILDETFVVDEHTLLVVEPGVEVFSAPQAGLEVRGSLQVEGTADAPVSFSERDEGQGWSGIRLRGGPVDVGSMSHASVSHAATALLIGTRAALEGVELTENKTALRLANPHGNVTIVDSRIYNNFEAVLGRTRHVVGIYQSDFWNNEINMIASPQKPFDCGSDHGLWDIHDNDILLGPVNSEGPAYRDVSTPDGSGADPYVVTMTDNWWGTEEMDFVQNRTGQPSPFCCPPPSLKEILVQPLSSGPNTSWEPPGEIITKTIPWSLPTHGDPGAISEIERPHHGDCYFPEDLPRLRGNVRPAVGGELEVELTLERRTSNGWQLVFGGRQPRYQEASYGRSWSLRLPDPLRPGAYKLTSWTGTEPLHLGRNIVKFRITS